MRKSLTIGVAAILGFLWSGVAVAQNYPVRTMTMIVPFPAGGATDTLARFLAERMRGILGQTVISLPSSLLKWELVQIVVSAVLFFTALAAMALFFFRRKTGDLTLIFFGLFSLLFSVRLLTVLQVIRSLSGYSETFWLYLNWSITCIIVLPFGLFLFQVVSESLRKWLRWVLILQAVFALVGLFGAAFGASLAKLYAVNNIHLYITRGDDLVSSTR